MMKNSKILTLSVLIALTLCLVALPGAKAATVTVTVLVKDSQGTGIAGVPIEYYTGSWQSFGTTGSSGSVSKDLAAGNYAFKATYAHTSQQFYQDVGVNPNVVFQTTLVTMKLMNHDGTSVLTGTGAEYYVGTWYTFGSGSTTTSMELLPGTYPFRVNYVFTSQQKTAAVAGSTTDVVFQTTLITVKLNDHNGAALSPGSTGVQYYSGAWRNFPGSVTPSSMELLPGNYAFGVNYAGSRKEKWQTVSGPTDDVVFQTTLVTIKLKNHDGTSELTANNPQYYTGTWLNFDSATTTTTKELLPNNYAFGLTYANARIEKWQDVSVDPIVEFQTIEVTMKVLASDDVTELAGQNAQYYVGSWYAFGSGTTTTKMELLPKNYAFIVSYNGASQQKWQDVSINPLVVFHTTKVTLQYSGTIKYWTGVWNTYTKPYMYMLPSTYPFQFDGYQTNIVVGDTDIQQSMVVVKFLKSGGAGISGGATQYYDGSWHPMGSTDGNGILIYGIPGLKGNLAFSMTYAGASTQKWQNIQTDSIVVFRTAPVTMKLFAHDGTTILTGTGAQYYTGVWNTFGTGTTTTSMELLPGNYCFKVTYAGASQQKWQTIALDPVNVVFQTTQVTMKLNDHLGNKLTPGGTNTQYYTGSWNNFGSGSTETSMELLPGNYAFRLSYNGASQQKWQVIGAGPMEDVAFQTTEVKMRVEKTDHTELAGTGAKYYTGTWNVFGSGNTIGSAMELLPGNYAFMVSYYGTSNQKWQVIGAGPSETVTFQTTLVTMTLLAHDGTTVLSGLSPKYYTGTWNNFGTLGHTTDSMELLPGNYAFSVSYNGATQQKWQNVGTNPNVVFQTTEVKIRVEKTDHTELAGTGAKYYTGTWNVFGSGNTIGSAMELLPGNYAFMVSYAGTANQKWQVIGAGPSETVTFTTTLVTMMLKDHNGGVLTGTNPQYYTGTWNNFGTLGQTTDSMELLPGNYCFKVTYAGASQQKWQNVGLDPNVVFTTTGVTFHFSGDISYYTGVWNTFTKPTMELLQGTYIFSFGGSEQPSKQVSLSITGTTYEKTVAYVRLLTSAGGGQSGATVRWWVYGGTSAAVTGSTDGSGVLLNVMDGNVNANTNQALTYLGAEVSKWQNPTINSFYIFQLTKVTVELRDNEGNLVSGASPVIYYWPYGGAEQTFGTMSNGKVSKDLLNGGPTFLFRIKDYKGTAQDLGPIANPATVVFQTGKVVDGGYGCTRYHQYGKPNLPFTDGIQLLPGSFFFDPGSKNLAVKAGQTLDIKTGLYTTP